jgi:hypothetical protein
MIEATDLVTTTRGTDLVRKAGEYRPTPTLKHFVLLEPDVVKVQVWSRGPDGDWPEPEELTALDEEISLSALGVRLPLREVYDGVPLETDPSA